jgi:hypothetical protein
MSQLTGSVATGNHSDDSPAVVGDVGPECAVCMEPVEWVAIGLCGHHEVCSKCTVHIRVFHRDRRCCICRQQCPAVVVTEAGRGSCVYDALAFLVNTGRVDTLEGHYWYHSISAAYFDDKRQFEETRSVCSDLDDPDEATSVSPSDVRRRDRRIRRGRRTSFYSIFSKILCR